MISNGKVTSPISLGDLARLLGCRADVGAVCTSVNINKASLVKPTWANRPNVVGGDLATYNVKAHSGYLSVGYGLHAPYCTNARDLKTTAEKVWLHDAPTAEGNNYKSLAMFDGYDHYARCQLMFDAYVPDSGRAVCSFAQPTQEGNNATPKVKDNALRVESLGYFDNWYYGAALFRGDTLLEVKSSGTAIPTDYAFSVTFGTDVASNTTYTIVPFVTNSAGISGNNTAGAVYVTLRYLADSFYAVTKRAGSTGSTESGFVWTDVTRREVGGGSYTYTLTIRNKCDTTLSAFNAMFDEVNGVHFDETPPNGTQEKTATFSTKYSSVLSSRAYWGNKSVIIEWPQIEGPELIL